MNECCIFKNLENGKVKLERDNFEFVEVLGESTRHTHTLYRCKKCGCLVYCVHEEIADFLSFDDHEDYCEVLFPVENIEEARKIEAENPFGVYVTGRPSLSRTWCSRWDEPEYWNANNDD